jgi:hypothetical protein
VEKVVAGGDRTCVVTEEGLVLCWGNSSWGLLGRGECIFETDGYLRVGTEPQHMGNNLRPALL